MCRLREANAAGRVTRIQRTEPSTAVNATSRLTGGVRDDDGTYPYHGLPHNRTVVPSEPTPATALFADAPESECLFVSDSMQYTRAAVRRALETDTPTRFLLTAELTETLERDRLTAIQLQQLLDDGTATVNQFDADRVETVAVYADELRVATPAVADHTERPFGRLESDDQVTALAVAYDARLAASEPVNTPIAEIGWSALLEAATDTFDAAFRDAFAAAAATAPAAGTRYAPVSLTGLFCLVAAGQDCTQKALRRFLEDVGLASQGTVTHTATDLEAAGLITRVDVPVDRRGRPPKRLHLANDSLQPAAYADALED